MPGMVGEFASGFTNPTPCSPAVTLARRAGAIRPGLEPGSLPLGRMLRLRGVRPRQGDFGALARRGLVVPAAGISTQFPGSDPRGETRDQEEDFRESLLRYVRDVEPRVVEETMQAAPTQVSEAMQHTLTNMLGTLPPEFFDVTVSTVAGNLSQLMSTVIMTGYMFRNAEIRMGLHRSLGLLPPGGRDGAPPVEECSAFRAKKTEVQGDVVLWSDETGAESMPAAEYMVQLEEEVKMLRDEVEEQQADASSNDLLAYIRGLNGLALEALTEGAGEEVKLAAKMFIQRLLKTSEDTEKQMTSHETTAIDLGKQLYWLMAVGYNLRILEVHHEMGLAYSRPAFGLPQSV